MDSSPTDVTNAAAIHNTSPEIATDDQDPSIFEGLSDLSPIKSANVESIGEGFTGLNSPPPVFSSPQTDTRRNSLDLKRIPFPLLSSLHDNDDKGKNIPTESDESEKFVSRLNYGLNPQAEKVPRSDSSGDDQTCSLGENFDDFLVDCADSTYSADCGLGLPAEVIAPDVLADCAGSRNSKESVNHAKKDNKQKLAVAVSVSPANFEQAKEENQGSSSSHLKPAEKAGENFPGVASSHFLKVYSDLPLDHVFRQRRLEQPVTKYVQGYNEYGQTTGLVVPNLPIANTISLVAEATESQLGKRRNLQHIHTANSPWNPSNSLSILGASASLRHASSSASLSSPSIIEEFNQARPKNRRKKTSESSDGDDFKSCNCLKTACLKLYCVCFAAGMYCCDSCACQECSNRPDNEFVISLVRDDIISTNPQAFSPKIIPHPTQAPAIHSQENGDRSAPLSQRHINGCTCKNSTCLKNYCVCYQAKVGCSDVCRCEGCKNSYGMKGGYNVSREVVGTRYMYLLPELWLPHGSTPFTPSFQFSDYVNDASDSGNGKGVGIFSSRFHKLDNNRKLSPSLPTYSTSGPPRSSELPKTRNLVTYPRPQFVPGSVSPVTPGRKYQQKNSDDILEDKTENPNPCNAAPPHSGSSSSSLSPLKGGQKIRLQAVSSSPPLTPSMGSKNSSNEKKKEGPRNARNNE